MCCGGEYVLWRRVCAVEESMCCGGEYVLRVQCMRHLWLALYYLTDNVGRLVGVRQYIATCNQYEGVSR